METASVHTPNPQRTRRTRQVAAVTVVAALMFGAGYAASWLRPAATTGAGPESAFAADVNAAGGQGLASLADLLPGLEAKVAANPTDMSQRMLLAQTYVELGQADKGIAQLRVLRKQNSADSESAILLATALLARGTPADLAEADKLLDDTARSKPAVLPTVRLYQGDIRMKQGDRAGAIQIWKGYLVQMPASDPRRALYEERIAQADGRT